MQAVCSTSSVPCCITSIFGFWQILIHFQQSSWSFISSSLARSFPSSCTWSFSRPTAYLQTALKNRAVLEPQHHIHVNQKSCSFKFLSLVPIFLSMIFPHVLNLAGKERTLTTYPWQNGIWYREILSWSSIWRNSLTQVYSSWILALLQERNHVLCFFQILILNGDSSFLFLALASYCKC